jgi:hypothetical protein
MIDALGIITEAVPRCATVVGDGNMDARWEITPPQPVWMVDRVRR